MVNELYQTGYFRRFAIGKYSAGQVMHICELCERHGWKKPDIYQGSYHAVQRSVEPELSQCLSYHGVAFDGFNPIAGRMLTEHEEGNRFDPKKPPALSYLHKQYWIDTYIDALDVIKPAAQKLGITKTTSSVRRASHHSLITMGHRDAMITEASGAAKLEEDLEKGLLSEEMVKAFGENGGANECIIPPESERQQIHTPNDFIPQRTMSQSIAIYWGMV